MKLYELDSAFVSVKNMFEAGEIDQQTFFDTLEQIQAESSEKVKNCVLMMKSHEANLSAISAEIERLKKLAESENNSIDWLKEYVKKSMIAQGLDKHDFGFIKLTLKKPTQKVEVLDESKIPADYWVVVPETKRVDKAGLSAALKVGQVEGARLVDGERALIVK